MVAKGIDDFRLNKILLGDSIDTAYVVLRLAPVGRHLPNAVTASVHDRMPVILDPDA
jgi:hypothetical protein